MTKPTTERMFTTREAMELLGISSRQTLYNWAAEPTGKAFGGPTAPLMWSESRIRELAEAHGRIVDL